MEHRVVQRADHPDDLAAALVACARGDRKALHTIFEWEAGKLVAIAQRIVRRRDLAEDVVQDTFVRIWTHAHQYEPGRGSARGWIYAIARNRSINMIRDGRRENTVEDIETFRDAASSDEAMAAWHRLGQDDRLRACMSGLDEDKRCGILMAYVAGYSHGEIAGVLRIPLGTAKSWIRRGLASLRECLA